MKTCICESDDAIVCKAYRYGLDAGDAHGPCMCSCHNKAHGRGGEAVEHGVQRTGEACRVAHLHYEFRNTMGYEYCFRCGERLPSR